MFFQYFWPIQALGQLDLSVLLFLTIGGTWLKLYCLKMFMPFLFTHIGLEFTIVSYPCS